MQAAIREIGATNCVDVHISELVDKSSSAQQMLLDASRLFEWIVDKCEVILSDRIAMLMVPLRNTERLELAVPKWNMLATDLSVTPPSVYVMSIPAYLQTDRANRFIAALDEPPFTIPGLSIYYQCWRNPEDPEEDGWARDVRLVHSGFVR
ncbi:MAG TPA: hypothetical protein VKP30_27395 [Polyangiaceae bacterium]|nr:hypothetical protein [Polyangiaceae bacterium]